jgi:2-phospho-L-lactate/phosphoenolpyruvate guanylyltransferase
MTPTTVAVLPVKRWGDAKRRLGTTGLSDGTRRALAEAMVTDVLIALRRAQRVDATLVVTGEPAAEALAGGYDAAAVHNAAALRGIDAALRMGAARVLLVPGDTPGLDPKQVDALLARPVGEREVVIVPDRHGTGTNALLLTPPDAMAPSFGTGSRERHERDAAAAGLRVEVVDVPTLALDVDTLADLEALRAALEAAHGNAANTRGLLARFSRNLQQ